MKLSQQYNIYIYIFLSFSEKCSARVSSGRTGNGANELDKTKKHL